MEDIYGEPTGPQFYLVSQEGYDDLRNIQTKLVVMAQVAYSDEDIESVNPQEEYAELRIIRDRLLLMTQFTGTAYANGSHDNILFIRRSTIGQLFADLSNHLVEVLELITQDIDRDDHTQAN